MPYRLIAVEMAMLTGSLLTAGVFAAEQDASGPLTAIGALVCGFTLMTGLLAWVVKYLLGTTIPAMQVTFRESLERQLVSFGQSLDRQLGTFQTAQDNFQGIVEKMHAAFSGDEAALRGLFEKKLSNEREFFERQLKVILEEFRADRIHADAAIRTNQNAILAMLGHDDRTDPAKKDKEEKT